MYRVLVGICHVPWMRKTFQPPSTFQMPKGRDTSVPTKRLNYPMEIHHRITFIYIRRFS